MRALVPLLAILLSVQIGTGPCQGQSRGNVDLELAGRPWTFNNGPEFHPGGSGSVSVKNEEEQETVQLAFDFSAGGTYVAARTDAQITEGFAQLRFRARADQALKLAFRLVDATGQIHQTSLAYSDAGEWQVFRVDLTRPGDHFGGSNDGMIHYPIQALEICVEKTSEPGTISFAAFEVRE